jgi:hypothetical protein
MPSDKRGGRGRSAIGAWRVKAGKKEVYRGVNKADCSEFIRGNKKIDGERCYLVAPNA